MSRQILAIDICNDTLAAVLMNTGLKGSTIQTCAQIPIPDDPQVKNRLQTALTCLQEHLQISQVATVVTLPADQAIYRTLIVPFKEDKKIRQILPFELEPTIPVGVDNLAIDYHKTVEIPETEVLAAAMDRNAVQHYLETFTEADLRPQLAVPGGFPLAAGLIANAPELPEQTLLLDVDTKKTTLFAIIGSRIALVRSLPSDITTDAAVEALALKIRQTLTAFADTRAMGFSPERLYLSGAALNNGSGLQHLATALEIPVQALDLRQWLTKIDTAEVADNWHPWQMNGALALAWMEAEGRPCLNFHRSGSLLRNYWSTYRPYVKGPAILLAIVLLLGLSSVVIDNYLLQKRVDQIETQMKDIFKAAFPDVQRVVDPLVQMRSKIDELKKGAVDPEQAGVPARSIDILYHVSQRIPKEIDVLFSRLVVGPDGVTISGEAAAFNAVDDIKVRLEKGDFFKQVTIASANMDKSGNKVLFKLKIDL